MKLVQGYITFFVLLSNAILVSSFRVNSITAEKKVLIKLLATNEDIDTYYSDVLDIEKTVTDQVYEYYTFIFQFHLHYIGYCQLSIGYLIV